MAADDDRKYHETLQRIWHLLSPELLILLRTRENFKLTINATAEGKQVLIEAVKHLRMNT